MGGVGGIGVGVRRVRVPRTNSWRMKEIDGHKGLQELRILRG